MVDAAEVKRTSQDIELVRHDWDREEAEALYELPFADLMFRAQSIHRANFDATMLRRRACSASRPAAVPRIAAIARRARITTPG